MLKRICVAFALLLSVLLSALIVFAQAASAQEVAWVRVVEDGVYLFATESDDQRCFLLEKSYYLRVADQTDRMYFVYVMENEKDFPSITGYVYKSQVEECSVPPIAPFYPTEKLTVTDTAQLKRSPVASAETVVSAYNPQKVSFYGSITSGGEQWYYVYYGGKFGYVRAESVTSPVIPLHPTPLPQKPVVAHPSTEEEQPEPEAESSTPASEILLIVFVVVLAVGLTLALFLPGNLKKKNSVFEQDI